MSMPGPSRNAAMCCGWTSRLEGHFEAGGKLHARSHTRHLVLAIGFNLAHGVIDGGCNQVFEDFLVFLHQAVIQADTFNVVATGHHHADQAGTGLAGDFGVRQLFLHLLHRTRYLQQSFWHTSPLQLHVQELLPLYY